jgi:adenosine kinase
MKLFLLGSIAFDTLGRYQGSFSEIFAPELLEDLSVSFVLSQSERHFGGCAGNVAYALGLLRTPATVCGVLGVDGVAYRNLMESWGMDLKFVEEGKAATAHAVIGTDLDGKQVAQFIPGALESAGDFELPSPAEAGDLFWIGPERKDRMLQAAAQAIQKGLRVFVDPGQLMHVFSGAELLELLEGAEALLMNHYEAQIFEQKTGLKLEQFQEKIPLLFVTQGDQGVRIMQNGNETVFPAPLVTEVNPTGAGDAFRAGILAGFLKRLPLEACAQAGNLLGAACVEHLQSQGYVLNAAQVRELKTLGFA